MAGTTRPRIPNDSIHLQMLGLGLMASLLKSYAFRARRLDAPRVGLE
jgi:hypothetical protein